MSGSSRMNIFNPDCRLTNGFNGTGKQYSKVSELKYSGVCHSVNVSFISIEDIDIGDQLVLGSLHFPEIHRRRRI